jgi:hypothetical protein
MEMARHWKIALAILGVSFVAALLTSPGLYRTVRQRQSAEATEEQARRDIAQPALESPTDTRERARLFWISPEDSSTLVEVELDLALSADPALRARQLLAALIAEAPSDAQRALPAATTILQFYLLPDGTAIADFSEALGNAMPSGILSEQLALNSIIRTLQANVPAITHLKILIRGQEAETLSGHIDLTGFFPVHAPQPAQSPAAAPAASSAGSLP